MLIIIIILLIMLIAFAFYLLVLKLDLRKLKEQLNIVKQTDTNSLLTTSTFDKDICAFTIIINDILQKQKEMLLEYQNAEKELKQTISNISHDLRTPLTSAIGYLQMVNSSENTASQKEEYLLIVEAKLRQLSELINQFFRFSKYIEGHIVLSLEELNICNLYSPLSELEIILVSDIITYRELN